MNIMKILTDNTMNSVIESNWAFPYQMSPRSSASNLAAPCVRILADDGNAAAQRECPKDKSGITTLGLAVLFVITAGTMWGWAIVHLGGLLLQAEALLLRNSYPLS